MKQIKTSYKAFLALGILIGMWQFVASCSDELGSGESLLPGEESVVQFSGTVSGTAAVTRGEMTVSSQYVKASRFPKIFYMNVETTMPDVAAGGNVTKDVALLGKYKVSEIIDGELDPIDGDNKLMWQHLRSGHTFYGWYLPWIDNPLYTTGPMASEYQPTLETLQNPVFMKFYDSPRSMEDMTVKSLSPYGNNVIYETLIGAKEGPLSYNKNGQYVPVNFHHLVSKIRVDTLTLITPAQVVINDVQANITFYGMPDEANFVARPAGGGMPVVTTIPPADPDNSLTYYIDNTQKGDTMYVCPEIDFSKVAFRIDLFDNGSNKYSREYGPFYGDFSNVKFNRSTPPVNYDDENGGDSKILHAGELMSMRIFLLPSAKGDIGVRIEEWNVEKRSDAVHHPHKGIYTDSEFASIIGAADNQEQIDAYYEMYGKEDEYGDKIFNLYDNVTVSGNTARINNKYTLDGNNHVLTFPSSSTEIKLKNVKNVYITNGKNTVYIDNDGNIYVVDSNFTLPPDPSKATSKMQRDKSNNITLSTGSNRV